MESCTHTANILRGPLQQDTNRLLDTFTNRLLGLYGVVAWSWWVCCAFPPVSGNLARLGCAVRIHCSIMRVVPRQPPGAQAVGVPYGSPYGPPSGPVLKVLSALAERLGARFSHTCFKHLCTCSSCTACVIATRFLGVLCMWLPRTISEALKPALHTSHTTNTLTWDSPWLDSAHTSRARLW